MFYLLKEIYIESGFRLKHMRRESVFVIKFSYVIHKEFIITMIGMASKKLIHKSIMQNKIIMLFEPNLVQNHTINLII